MTARGKYEVKDFAKASRNKKRLCEEQSLLSFCKKCAGGWPFVWATENSVYWMHCTFRYQARVLPLNSGI